MVIAVIALFMLNYIVVVDSLAKLLDRSNSEKTFAFALGIAAVIVAMGGDS